jgi:two-component system sensor histidine kinase CpxA
VNRLSLRIFVGIFAALLLIAAGAVLITGWIVSERRDSAPEAIAELTRAAREAADQRGRAGLADWLRSRNARLFGRPVFIVDDAGRDLLARPLPGPPRLLRSPRWPVVYVEDGMRWRLVVPPRRTGWLGVFSLPEARLPLIAFALLIAGLVSALLARSITRPIADLQRATLALAGGDLSAQVTAATRGRGDEIGRLGAAFDAMANDLRALVEHRERLLRDVSHELRSPLARMRLAIGLAQRPDADVQAQLARLETEIGRLDGLIGGILDVARLESGPSLLRLEPVDLAALLQQLVADARFEAEATGRHVVARGPERLQIDADPHWLGAAIENVLRNALRHAPPDSTVEVELRTATAPRRAEIEIRDRGAGVPADALGKIFEPFYRVDAPRPDGDAGVGLGLAIAARSVRAHGGQIVARNASPGLAVTLSL